tara:strand:+ start:887 stop:1036 length:150 start_codon:yes stop_codon:yes gene_type:complete
MTVKQPKTRLLRIVSDVVVATTLILLIKGEKLAQVLKNKGESFFADKDT